MVPMTIPENGVVVCSDGRSPDDQEQGPLASKGSNQRGQEAPSLRLAEQDGSQGTGVDGQITHNGHRR